MKVKTKKNLVIGMMIVLASLLCSGVGILCVNRTTAHAASNTGIQTFTGTEYNNHYVSSTLFNPKPEPTDYSETISRNTGIKIYGTTNNGSSLSTNYLKSDSSTICVDFTNAADLYFPSDKFMTYYDKNYSFQILSGSTVKWQATYTGSSYSQVTGKDENGNDVTTTYYTKILDINGRSTTTTSTDSSLRLFDPAEFGSNIVSLNDGTYTIKISRSYFWSKKVGSSFIIFPNVRYDSTSTLTGTLNVDTTSPTLTMRGYSSGSTIANGAYKNERVTFMASDRNHNRLYYKTPTSSNYSYTTGNTYTSGTTNGWYYVYAEDTMGHRSPEYSFYYDNTAPTGRVYSNGTSIASGAYISKAFSYSATDNGSGVTSIYYKTPVSGTYQPYSSGTVIPANAGDGWYYFYSVDRCGNQSATTSVYLETQAPLVEIYRNDELVYSKTVTGAGTFDTDIYLNPNDKLRISCDTSSGKVTSNYALDTNITIGSAYSGSNYTISLTSATGITSNFNYHIVRNKPTITIDGNTYSSGSTLHFNSDKPVRFNDDSVITNSGNTGAMVSSEGNVNLNEHITYASGSGKTLTTASGTETKYILMLNDRAGNESRFTVFIDKLAPVGVWKANGATLPNGGYTNKPLSFNITEAGVTATYSYNGGEYAAYTSGKTLTADGTYHVVLTDLAGNKSTFTAYIDTVAPTGQIYANNQPVQSGTITNKSVFFSWDGDITATVNGMPYTKNSVLSEDSAYHFILTDLANNSTEYVITIDTVAPTHNADKLNNSQQLISKWYVATIGDKQYSFATYAEALAFASNNEFNQNVTVLTLNDISDFKQHHLIANGDEVRTGEYWLYKSKANPDSLLYYFDRNGLNEVVEHYAKTNVSEVNYFVLDDDNLYGEVSGSMSDNLFTAPNGTKAPLLNGFVFDKADGSELFAELVGGNGTSIKIEYGIAFDKQISVGGLYKLIEFDDAKNQTVFYGFIDVLAPEIKAEVTVIGEDMPTEMTVMQDGLSGIAAYYYKRFAVTEISDADTWVVLMVENGGRVERYTYGDRLPCLEVGGEYLLTIYDRLGNGYSFTVFIIGNPANIVFNNNGDDTAFDITITLEQKFDTVVSLEIKRNGEILNGVTTDKFQYLFDRTGVYTVILRDNFGRVIEKEYTFNKALPIGTLDGVESDGKTKTDVTFTYDNSKYSVAVTKDGKAVETENSGKLVFTANDKNSGSYDIRLTRITDEENFTDYTFVINTLAPDFSMSVADKATTNKNVTITWTATDIVSVTYSLNGGEAVEIENGAVLTAEGNYTVTATNDLGTVSVKTFTIDRTLDYDVIINDAETFGVDTTNSNVTVINNEPLYVSVSKNGAPFEFIFGQVLSGEGLYIFRISDDYNNSTSFTIVIDKSVDVEANVGNGVISNEDVIISAGEKVNLIATKDGIEYSYALGTAITDEGFYKFTVYDSFGNEKSLSFQIVKGTKTKLDYTLSDSVEIVSIDRDGEAVLADGNRLNFTIDGTYTVVCKSEGKEYTFMLSLDTTAPTISLNGIEDGGKGNVTVTITDLSEAGTVEIYKDGEKIEYELGSEIKEYGSYEVRVCDELGNERTYSFVLSYKMSGGIIALITMCCMAAVGVGLFFFIKKYKRH